MIDIYDSEAIIKCYRLLNKKCKAIDGFIKNHSLYYSTTELEYGALDTYNNIIDLMARKNQLINLKVIVDFAINSLDDKDRQVLYLKTHYSLPMREMCSFLGLKERTAFRRIDRAFINLTEALNNSAYNSKLNNILQKELWINNVREDIKERKMNFKNVTNSL